MDKFLENWKNDKKFRTKVKLILYTAFVVIVRMYALSLNNTQYDESEYTSKLKDKETTTNKENTTNEENIIKLKDTYEYKITIEIDDKKYEYSGRQDEEKRTIEKKNGDTTKKYIYKNNEYYIEDKENNYTITTKDEVYDVVNYNYISIDTINEYLKKATEKNNQYLVYIKNVILGSDSERYFVIDINKNNIYIDYTALMKEFNSNIKSYKVSIEIKE